MTANMNYPDPISMMEQISPNAGAGWSAGWKDSIDSYINGLIHRAGDLFGAGVNKAIEGGVAATNAVSNMTRNVASPMIDGVVAVAPGREEESVQAEGQGRTREIAAETSMTPVASLNLEGAGKGLSQIEAVKHVEPTYDYAPLATGVAQARGQGVSV